MAGEEAEDDVLRAIQFEGMPDAGPPPEPDPSAYDGADLYGIDGDDGPVTYFDEWECICEKLERIIEGADDVEQAICDYGPMTVGAYQDNDTRASKEIAALAIRCADLCDESWCDEHGDPNGDSNMSEAERVAFGKALEPIIRENVSRKVYPTKRCASRTYSPDELIAMARENCPEWFEGDTEKREPGCMCHLEAGDSPCPVHGEEEPANA